MRSFRLTIVGLLVVTAGIAVLMLTGCQKKVFEKVDQGTFENSVYHNNYFDMSIKIPGSLSFLDKKQMEMIINARKRMLNGIDKNLKGKIERAKPMSIKLFAVFKHPPGTPVPFNPNLACFTERVRHLRGINRGRDYHYHTRKLLKMSGANMKTADEIHTETLDGVTFDIMSIEINLGDPVIYQKQYAAIIKGYALLFAVTYSTPEQENFLGDILNTLTFQ